MLLNRVLKPRNKKCMFRNKEGELSVGRIIGWSVVGLFVLIIIFGSFGTVGAGERGVKTRFGAVTGSILNPGLYLKMPFVEGVQKIDVQIQKEQTTAEAASSDLQNVKAEVALNYQLDSSQVANIYRNIGDNDAVNNKIIAPAMQEVVKSVTANYTAEQLISKRQDVTNSIQTQLTAKLQTSGILVDAFNVTNFDFSSSFNQAVEAKVTAEQNALAAKNKLDQVQYEAQQRVAEADGEAKAITIQQQALNAVGGQAYIQLQAINKWDGKLPQYMTAGSATPFVNVK